MSENPSAIGREIRQTKPFRSKGQEATLGLFRTTDLLHRLFTEVLQPYCVTKQQYNVLRILRGARAEGLPTLAIGERMVERTPGITRLLDRLETKTLVSRKRGREDRRCVHCRITPQGTELLAALDGPVDEANDASLAMLTTREQEQLVDLLDRIRAGHSAATPTSTTEHTS